MLLSSETFWGALDFAKIWILKKQHAICQGFLRFAENLSLTVDTFFFTAPPPVLSQKT